MKPHALHFAYRGACDDSDCGVDGKTGMLVGGIPSDRMAVSTGSWWSQLRTAATVGLVLLIEVMGCRWGPQVMLLMSPSEGDVQTDAYSPTDTRLGKCWLSHKQEVRSSHWRTPRLQGATPSEMLRPPESLHPWSLEEAGLRAAAHAQPPCSGPGPAPGVSARGSLGRFIRDGQTWEPAGLGTPAISRSIEIVFAACVVSCPSIPATLLREDRGQVAPPLTQATGDRGRQSQCLAGVPLNCSGLLG